jgi:hypothetical protein
MNDKKSMWIALVVAVLCMVAAKLVDVPTRDGDDSVAKQTFGIVGGLALFVAIFSGRHVVAAWRARDRTMAERKQEANALTRGVAIGPWLLGAAALMLVMLILIDAPALQLLGTGEVVKALAEKLMITILFFVPLAFLVVFAPLVSALDRSVLLWGIGLIATPINFFIAGRLISLARQELRDRQLAASASPDLRQL